MTSPAVQFRWIILDEMDTEEGRRSGGPVLADEKFRKNSCRKDSAASASDKITSFTQRLIFSLCIPEVMVDM